MSNPRSLPDFTLGPSAKWGGVSRVPNAIAMVRACEGNEAVEVVLGDSHLARQASLGRLAGRSISAHALAAHRASGRVFAADVEGVAELRLDAGPVVRAGGFPAPAREPAADGTPTGARRSMYHWLMNVDATGSVLRSLWTAAPMGDQLVSIDLGSHEIVSAVPLPGWAVGITLGPRHEHLVLPALRDGPQLLKLSGEGVARMNWTPESGWGDQFSDAAIHPTKTMVAVAGNRPGLWLWNWATSECRKLLENARAPIWGASGDTLYFMRGCSELWKHELGGGSELVVGGPDLGVVEDQELRRNWITRLHLSPDGRFLLAQLTMLGSREKLHCGVVHEPATGGVHIVADFHGYSLAWI